MPSIPSSLSVALAVVRNKRNEVLLSYRKKEQYQGEQWEFPGGKLEPSESYKSALRRELFEETDLVINCASSLIQFRYQYPNLTIHFQVFLIDDYEGEVDTKKCPSCRWQSIGKLSQLNMPNANRIIVNALRMPTKYMITANHMDARSIAEQVRSNLDAGISLIQLRTDSLARADYVKLAAMCYRLCDSYKAKLIVNCPLECLSEIEAHGLHLKSSAMHLHHQVDDTSISRLPLFSISVHNEEELELANLLAPQCVLIAPVLPTVSHPGTDPLDWSGFHSLALRANCPAYALGGMQHSYSTLARAHAGQGVAGIGMFKK